eukprot:7931595-Pyramimonas_sp.AAC.1
MLVHGRTRCHCRRGFFRLTFTGAYATPAAVGFGHLVLSSIASIRVRTLFWRARKRQEHKRRREREERESLFSVRLKGWVLF